MLSEIEVAQAVKVFISYSPEDRRLKDQLNDHLSPLTHRGSIQIWDKQQITAGSEREKEFLKHFDESKIILCLVSSNFISSEQCYEVELPRALARRDAGKAVVIPVLLKYVDWSNTHFNGLQVIPRNRKPIAPNPSPVREKVFTEVVQEIERVVKSLRRKLR